MSKSPIEWTEQTWNPICLSPLKRRKPTTYFVNSMGDLFHEYCPDDWIDRVFAVMALCPQHTFQVLTKRAARMREYFAKIAAEQTAANEDKGLAPRRYDQLACDLSGSPCAAGFMEDVAWPLPNVWLGVSTERQQEADERIPLLLNTPAAVRFISAEPLLRPIDLTRVDTGEGASRNALDWVIVGGESGHNARPMHPDWARSLRDQCAAAGVAFFFKQWGNWKPLDQFSEKGIQTAGKHAVVVNDGRFVVDTDVADPPRAVFTFSVSKKRAGRLLDGIEHNGMPK